jgi:hypothetical protein
MGGRGLSEGGGGYLRTCESSVRRRWVRECVKDSQGGRTWRRESN